ncbi:MAG: LacI family transcriptional regulator [Actinomycetota bacterium]|nr:LacI family transcriptional regulator [Actinomycetota bacterium]
MTVRLADVAQRTGVCVKTVSNVVHGYEHVKPLTRGRVQAALDELDYRPNLSARALAGGQSGLIALAVPALDMPYFAELAGAVVDAATERGWTVLVDQTGGLREQELEAAAGLRGRLIDGLILSPMALEAEELSRAQEDTPLVLLGEKIFGGPVDHVAVDNVAAAFTATCHLLELGRHRVGAIGCQADVNSGSGVAGRRRAGFEQALSAAGVPVDSSLAPAVDGYRRVDGARAMAWLLETAEPPDAVFCFNDLLALGALRVLAERGVQVPDDVAVIGFDDIEDGRFCSPSLSTVAPAKQSIASQAVDMLHERINRPKALAARDVTVDFELLARESTLGRTGSPCSDVPGCPRAQTEEHGTAGPRDQPTIGSQHEVSKSSSRSRDGRGTGSGAGGGRLRVRAGQ